MLKVRFRGAELRSITGNMEEGGIIYRLHFVATLSDKVSEVMNWDVLDEKGMLREGLENPKLAGILRTDQITLEPNGLSGEEKEKHSLQFEAIRGLGLSGNHQEGGRVSRGVSQVHRSLQRLLLAGGEVVEEVGAVPLPLHRRWSSPGFHH